MNVAVTVYYSHMDSINHVKSIFYALAYIGLATFVVGDDKEFSSLIISGMIMAAPAIIVDAVWSIVHKKARH